MNKKKLSILFIICLANSLMYVLPYLQSTYYESMRTAYGFTHIQMGNLISVHGIFNIPAYILGGVIADSFDTKKLFIFSLAATGLAGLYSAILPSYPVMVCVYIVWSFTTILGFWSAMIKAVKVLADEEHQSQLFSLKETMCCVIGLILSTSALLFFNFTGENFVSILSFYSIALIVVAVLVFFFMPSQPSAQKPDLKGLVEGIKCVVKLKGVWLIGLTLLCCQTIGAFLGRFTPFFTNIGGLSDSVVATITIICVSGIANIGSIYGGKISAMIGSPSKFISYVMILCSIMAVVFIISPWGREYVAISIIICAIFRILNGALRSVVFATMSQVNIPQKYTGTASGVISVIGYLPDVFAYSFCGAIMETFEPVPSYKIIFIALAVCAIFGSFVSATLHKYSLKLKKL